MCRSMPPTDWPMWRSGLAGWRSSISTVPRACSRSMSIGMAWMIGCWRLVERTASRLALHPARGLAYLTEPASNFAVLQLRTRRTAILFPRARSFRVITGDGAIYCWRFPSVSTDDDIRVAIDVQSPSGDSLTLSVDEAVTSGDIAVLQFEGGSTLRPLTDGLNEVRLSFSDHPASSPRNARLHFLPLAARSLRRERFDSRHPTMCQAISRPCASVRIGAVVGDSNPSIEVGVAGFFSDMGRAFNLTSALAGTE